jgi:hypothetical protein
VCRGRGTAQPAGLPYQRRHRAAVALAIEPLARASKIVRGLRQGLTEAERYAVADHVVAQLKQRGDPWHLSDEARPSKPPST